MDPSVSIVVCTKNCKHTISDLLSSLRSSNYPTYEVVVVDSSNDGTDKIVMDYDVKLVHTPPIGLNYARNMGIRASTGDIICFTDGDCRVTTEWCKNIVSTFKANRRIACVGGSIIIGSPNDFSQVRAESFLERYLNETCVPLFPNYKKNEVIPPSQQPYQPFSETRYPAGCNMAFRRDVLKKVGGFYEEIPRCADEFEIMERILRRGYLIAVNPKAIVFHGNLTLLEVLRKVYGYGKELGTFEKMFHTVVSEQIKSTGRSVQKMLLYYSRKYREDGRLLILLYPFIDTLIGIAYYLGAVSAR